MGPWGPRMLKKEKEKHFCGEGREGRGMMVYARKKHNESIQKNVVHTQRR